MRTTGEVTSPSLQENSNQRSQILCSVQCLSDLARLENRGSSTVNGGNSLGPRSISNASGQLARIAAAKGGGAKSLEDLTAEDTEKLLAEKDEEILRMQDMIRQMQTKMEMGSV